MRSQPVYGFTPWETARRFGLIEGLKALAGRVLKFNTVVIVAWDISEAEGLAQPDPGMRQATADDGPLFEAAGFSDMLEGKLAQGPGWISVGDDGLRAWNFLDRIESQLADWLIVRTEDPACLWSVGTWVSRDHRGRGLANRIRLPAIDWCRARGHRELVGWVNLVNHSSLRTSHKIGYRAVGRVTFWRRGGFAAVRHGDRWRFGRWSAAEPLVLSLEGLRQAFGEPQSLEPLAVGSRA